MVCMRLWLFFGSLFIWLLSACPVAFAKLPSWDVDRLQNRFHDPSIFGGAVIGPHSLAGKYTVGVGTANDVFCSGTLIAKNMVLTAGHCVMNPAKLFPSPIDPSHLQAHFFSYKKTKNQRWQRIRTSVPVTVVAVHPVWKEFVDSKTMNSSSTPILGMEQRYEREAPLYAYDLAILYLVRDAPDDKGIARLPTEEKFEKSRPSCTYFVTGFGDDSTSTAKDRKNFRATYGAVGLGQLKVTELAIERSGLPSVCFGDSGGPLLEKCGDTVSVVGIASHLKPDNLEKGCEDPGSVSVHVSVHRSIQWILQQLQINDQYLRL